MTATSKTFPGNKLVKVLNRLAPQYTIVRSFVLVYEGQTPNVAVYLRQGALWVGNRKFTVSEGQLGQLFLFNEMVNRTVLSQALSVVEGAKISPIDRPSINEIIQFSCLT